MLDKWSLYRLAQYCDELVPDGLGGQEPRFTCNIYLQSAEDAYSILTKLAGVFELLLIGMGIALFVMLIFHKIPISHIPVQILSGSRIIMVHVPVIDIMQ